MGDNETERNPTRFHTGRPLAIIMKKRHYYLFILLFLIFGCVSQKTNSRFKTYEIFPSLSLQEPYDVKVNELKFMPKYNAIDAQKFMFQKFGKWNNILSVNRTYPLLIWSDLKLFDWSDELYTVGVGGDRKKYSYYCSAFVLNSKSEDCLVEKSEVKDSLVNLFMLGTEQIRKVDKQFETEIKTINKKKLLSILVLLDNLKTATKNTIKTN